MRADLEKALKEAKDKKRLNPLMGKGLYEMIDKQLLDSEEVIHLRAVNVGIITQKESIKVKPYNFSNKTPGILTITTKRILHCSKVLFNTKVEQIALENINNIQSQGVLLSSVLRIESLTNIMEIDLPQKDTDEITKLIHELMENIKDKPIQSSPAIDDPIVKIEKLKELKEKGILTEEEFQKKKEDLLSKI
ncbi:SHOCT domain-containing protein [Alkaliphilus peptidifermentans]|uniref:PH domain-containing protein n=1 Tax=Alkaliphilus peptidifermentans DSM 18978 TaxID=1120976 RepID=A0A1G5JSF1_9FIRM|nr:SHOCT domain-containing protein [Alkaliphilus peptidifermentans]SCY91325.1 PH domain-containing protein [Alkaliphilus peptidifermentans DSM 18978]